MLPSWNCGCFTWHSQFISFLFTISTNLIPLTTMYSKPRHRKANRVLSFSWETFPPFYINTCKKINILIMYSSNLLLTQSLTSLRACPAVARSYQGRMPQPCPASLCLHSGNSRFFKADVSSRPERLIFTGQRKPDGDWGSEILDEGCEGLPEFKAAIKPAG